ncbi:ASCH domain-containing protein [Dinoroseobacter sp. S124A]|uniref:ASCH domain-containing protein n=1 Tax=Dinoroseobacter sp. S124A TaxID=3415128 RepID=UPI003C7CE33B
MPRNISFAMTTEQVRNRTKDVTRRFGWWFLKPGDRLCGVKKSMGLRKGETIERLCMIEVISTRAEPLNQITQDDVVREGFPDWKPADFVRMLVDHYRIDPSKECNRIEFKYIEDLTE